MSTVPNYMARPPTLYLYITSMIHNCKKFDKSLVFDIFFLKKKRIWYFASSPVVFAIRHHR